MKVLVWRGDREIERVTGVYYQIGYNCEKLSKLLNANWTFAGTVEPDPESDEDTIAKIIHSTGLLVPEPENSVDKDAVAVYLKMATKIRKFGTPPTCMIKIGYLPYDSKLKKAITQPVQVNLRCRTISALLHGNYFQAKVIGLPLGLDPKDITKLTFNVNVDDDR